MTGDIACRWWLDNERRLVRPRVVVALGGSAALAVFGRAMPIMKSTRSCLPRRARDPATTNTITAALRPKRPHNF